LLRHTFAQIVSRQVPRDVLSKLLGHSDEATTRYYYYEVRDKRAMEAAKTIRFWLAGAA
jgi:integrase